MVNLTFALNMGTLRTEMMDNEYKYKINKYYYVFQANPQHDLFMLGSLTLAPMKKMYMVMVSDM